MTAGNKKISSFLLKSFLFSAVLSLVVHFFINMTSHRGFEQKQADFMESIAGIVWLLFLTICAVTIYFNLLQPVRRSPALSLLSFILLPAIAIGVFWYMNKSDGEWLSFWWDSGIFLLVQVYLWMTYRQA